MSQQLVRFVSIRLELTCLCVILSQQQLLSFVSVMATAAMSNVFSTAALHVVQDVLAGHHSAVATAKKSTSTEMAVVPVSATVSATVSSAAVHALQGIGRKSSISVTTAGKPATH